MKHSATLSAFFAGLVFGTGLLLSGMVNPGNVLAFLDVTGHWKPALALTMAAAIAVAGPAYWLARRRGRSILAGDINWPDRFGVNARLIAGSAIFGVGWGLSGICPGPGILLLTRPGPHALSFILGTVVGMLVAGRWPRTRDDKGTDRDNRTAPAVR